MRKRHLCQINARRRAKVMEDVDALDRNLLELLGDQITEVESRIKTNLKADDAVRSRAGNLRSIPGVGPVLTAILIAELPELGTICDKQIAALAGLAPSHAIAEACVANVQSAVGVGKCVMFCSRRRSWRHSTIRFSVPLPNVCVNGANRTKSS